MASLALSLRASTGKGREIDIPFRELADIVDFRTGDMAVMAGAPGGGKGVFATNWAWQSDDPVIYLAQDTPRSVQTRLVALALGEEYDTVSATEDEEYWAEQLDLRGERDTLTLIKGPHTVDMIKEQIYAHTEWLGEVPKLVIVDNLIDMPSDKGGHTENTFYADVLNGLKQLAIEMDVGILILHHVTRSGEGGKKHGLGTEWLRLTDLLHAGEREARHVWAIHKGFGSQTLELQVLKQQDGPADPEGWLYKVSLLWEPSRGRLWSR